MVFTWFSHWSSSLLKKESEKLPDAGGKIKDRSTELTLPNNTKPRAYYKLLHCEKKEKHMYFIQMCSNDDAKISKVQARCVRCRDECCKDIAQNKCSAEKFTNNLSHPPSPPLPLAINFSHKKASKSSISRRLPDIYYWFKEGKIEVFSWKTRRAKQYRGKFGIKNEELRRLLNLNKR